jgi:hypothetical protein
VRSALMRLIKSLMGIRRLAEMSFSARQNASSKLMLVLCPAMTTECLTMDVCMAVPPFDSPVNSGTTAEYLATYDTQRIATNREAIPFVILATTKARRRQPLLYP